MMKPRSFAMLCSLMLLGLGFAVSQAGAQVLVYKLEILKESGINYQTFDGGYFAAPLLGGTGTFLLTSSDGSRTFSQSDNSGRLFTAVDGNAKKAVISAVTGSGTAQGALVALGSINYLLNVSGPTVNLSIKVAKTLTGTGVSSDDESTASAPAADGSIGSAGVSQIRLVLDEPQTKYSNNHGLSLTQTVDELKKDLARQGYTSDATTTTATTTGTSATSTTGTTSGQ